MLIMESIFFSLFVEVAVSAMKYVYLSGHYTVINQRQKFYRKFMILNHDF